MMTISRLTQHKLKYILFVYKENNNNDICKIILT